MPGPAPKGPPKGKGKGRGKAKGPVPGEKRSVRQIHWVSVEPTSTSIWGQLPTPRCEVGELEGGFLTARGPAPAPRARSSESFSPEAFRVEILLAPLIRAKVDLPALRARILAGEPVDGVTAENCLQAAASAPVELREPAQSLLTALRHDSALLAACRARLAVIRSEEIPEVLSAVESLSRTCARLRSSRALPIFLANAIRFGNILNRGHASAVRVEGLPLLAVVEDKHRKSVLVHLRDAMSREYPGTLQQLVVDLPLERPPHGADLEAAVGQLVRPLPPVEPGALADSLDRAAVSQRELKLAWCAASTEAAALCSFFSAAVPVTGIGEVAAVLEPLYALRAKIEGSLRSAGMRTRPVVGSPPPASPARSPLTAPPRRQASARFSPARFSPGRPRGLPRVDTLPFVCRGHHRYTCLADGHVREIVSPLAANGYALL